MLKLIDSSSFFPEDEINITLLNLRDVSSSGLEKCAADERISNYVTDVLKPKETHAYIHINAMGAGETYGSNKNGDWFDSSQLKQYHKTFEETGYIYRHHQNKNPEKAMGRVIFSIYNERMHRVELIAEIDKILARDLLDRMEKGDYPKTSMACKTPYDTCSICGNTASSRQEYCIHLTTQLNKLLPDGRKVMALNLAPLRFFDLSAVISPADVTSSVMQKVAFDNSSGVSMSDCFLSIDAAIEEGLVEQGIEKRAEKIKEAAFNKLSELIKVIDDGTVLAAGETVKDMLAKTSEPKEDLLDILSSVPLEDSFNALAELGMSPSIAFLANLIVRKLHGGKVDSKLGHEAEEAILKVHPSKIGHGAMALIGHIDEKDANPHLVAAIARRSDSSLEPAMVEKRASRYYEGNLDTSSIYLPHYDVRSKEERQHAATLHKAEEESSGTGMALLGIGGAAVLAKMIIAALVKEKMEKFIQNRVLSAQASKDELKYRGVIKSASVSELCDKTVYFAYAKSKT